MISVHSTHSQLNLSGPPFKAQHKSRLLFFINWMLHRWPFCQRVDYRVYLLEERASWLVVGHAHLFEKLQVTKKQSGLSFFAFLWHSVEAFLISELPLTKLKRMPTTKWIQVVFEKNQATLDCRKVLVKKFQSLFLCIKNTSR